MVDKKSYFKSTFKWILILTAIPVSVFLIFLMFDVITGNFVEPTKCVQMADASTKVIMSDVVMYQTRTVCYKIHEPKFWKTPFFGKSVKYSGWLFLYQKNNGIWMYKGSWVPV